MITFNNGKTLETVGIYGGNMQYQSANRSTLEIRCAADSVTFEELKALYTDANALSELTISEEKTYQLTTVGGEPYYIDAAIDELTLTAEGNEPKMVTESVVQSVHLNYTLPVELKLTTIDSVDMYCMKLAQMSALEIAQAKQADDIAVNEAALIELAEMIAGGTE